MATFTLILFGIVLLFVKPDTLILDRPIQFSQKRIDMTLDYIHTHYDANATHITIDPRIIVLHWTEDDNLTRSFGYFDPQTVPSSWGNVTQASPLNVSAHFLIDREGRIWRLMSETTMARHVIRLNMDAIGIENVGGEGSNANLTPAQLTANIALVAHLKHKYPKIDYLIGHYEYTLFEGTPFWREKNATYRTPKSDPNPQFVEAVYEATRTLGLKRASDIAPQGL
ncbi:MAG: hypothetical protein KU37_05900 [Sulfuricurvum sp. PC08-66]|nr:MAG: hypothetical protein KU37_05900 [Sulfuricurvum sp. PC08-66]